MAIVYGPQFKNPPKVGAVRAMAIGNRNLREGPGLKYPVIDTLPEANVAMLTQYNTWENPGEWLPGVPDRWWALIMNTKDQLLGWVCIFEAVSVKGGKNPDDLVYKQFCWQVGKTLPSDDDYQVALKQQKAETKKFNAIMSAKKATGAKIPAEREPLPDTGDAPSSVLPVALGIGAVALLAWKFWPR